MSEVPLQSAAWLPPYFRLQRSEFEGYRGTSFIRNSGRLGLTVGLCLRPYGVRRGGVQRSEFQDVW